MVDNPKQRLKQFLRELTRRKLDVCVEILEEFRDALREQPYLLPWYSYFSAVMIQEQRNDFSAAADCYRRLLEMPDLPLDLRGQVLISLSGVISLIGNYAEAISFIHQASTHFCAQNEWQDEAKVRSQLGLYYYMGYNSGDFGPQAISDGLTACHQALERLATLPTDAETEDSAILVWNTLGLLYTNLLNWPSAIHAYEQLLAICERSENEFGTFIAQGNLGQAYRKLGPPYWQQATSALTAALAGFRRLARPYEELIVLAELATFHDEMNQVETMQLTFVQAIALLETVRASSSGEAARAGFQATVSDLMGNAVLASFRIDNTVKAFDYMEQAKSRALLDLLAFHSSELESHLAIPALTLAEVQKALPTGTLLLAYFTTGLIEDPDRFTPSTIVAERPRSPRSTTLIFAVTSTSLTVHDLQLSPNDLLPSILNAPVEEYFLEPGMRHALYDSLLAPVAQQVADSQVILVSPHGPLHYVPFVALLKPDGETWLQTTQKRLVYIPSASILFRRRDNEPNNITSRKLLTSYKDAKSQDNREVHNSCLTIGYNGETLLVDDAHLADGEALKDSSIHLRYAEDEALAIARLTGGNALVGPQPKKVQLLQQATEFRWLHFSCHCHFDAENPLASSLQIAQGEKLTAQEIYQGLKIHSDLVTLSACASGLSRVRRGDELYGMVRALLFAGASCLLVTQWRVDERPTHLLMCKFYERMMQGEDFSSALQNAQAYLRTLSTREAVDAFEQVLNHQQSPSERLTNDIRKLQQLLLTYPAEHTPFADPHYWAAFILIQGS